jgi:hypothetical protein
VQTQKDHVDAYSFLIGRMTSALVVGDASHLEAPARRAWLGLLIGVLLSALIFAGFLVFGLITHSTKPASQRPAAPGSVAVQHLPPGQVDRTAERVK